MATSNKNVPTDAEERIERLQAELADVKEAMQRLLEDAGNEATNILPMARDQLQRMAKQAGMSVREFVEHRRAEATQLRQNAEQTIQRRPFTSTTVAFAAGLLIAGLLVRRGNH